MISTDTLEDNTAFAKKESADFPILADPTKTTAAKYGVLREFPNIGTLPNRWTFYIGPDGRILQIETKVNPKTAGEDLVSILTALKVPAAKP